MFGIENIIPEVIRLPFAAISVFFVIQFIYLFVIVVISTPQGNMNDNLWGITIAHNLVENLYFRTMGVSYIAMSILLGLYSFGANV